MESSCIICKKSFSSNSALRKHYRLKHPGMEQPSKRRGRPIKNVIKVIKKNAKCSQCLKAFGSSTAAKVHETIVHGRTNTVLLYFPNVDGFMAWKREEEDRIMCRFVKVRASQKKKDFERIYYVCHRSGHFVSKSKHIRHLKLQGSCKIGQECTSFIKVKINASEFVTVNYCPVHTGHTAQMAHLTMRMEDRQELARHIDEGTPFDDILDKVRMTCSNECISYMHYIGKQDLHNIAKEFGLSKSQKCFHKNDAVQTPLKRDGIAYPNARPEVAIEDHLAQVQMETHAILTCFSGHPSELKLKQKTGFCDILRFLLSSFENEEDPETITECFERAKKLKSFYLATKKSNSTSLIPKQQADKKVDTQKTFYLSSREPICTRPLGKPTSTEKYNLMNSLDGTMQCTSAERLHDHNYACKN